jgi:nucleotide-binding universal stress UspA family protein
MSDTNNEATVPITVPRQSPESDEGSFGYDGEVIHHPDYSVVVPVVSDLFNSDTGVNARRFLQTAIALADDNDGQVVLLGIAAVDDETALEQIREYAKSDDEGGGEEQLLPEVVTERRSQLAQVANVAEGINQDLPIRAVVRVVTDTTQGILDALGAGSETAVLLLRGTGFEERWSLGNNTVDTVIDEAECDVFVENVGVREGSHALYVPDVEGYTVAPLAESEAETIDSILLPVGTGPHSALAAEAARAVARTFDASVTVLHVIDPNASGKERSDAKDLLTFAEYILGPEITSETELREASDPTDIIIEKAQNHDFTSIGSPEQKFRLRDLVFKPVQETLIGERDITVLMGRDADRTTRSLYYRYTQAMENLDTEERPG